MNTDFNYSSVASLIQAAEKNNLPVSALVLSQQAQQIELDEKTVYEKMASNFQVMKECIEPGCDEHLKSTSGLTGGDAFKLRRYSESGKSLTGSFLSGALYRALAVSELNASMGRIVAAHRHAGDKLRAALVGIAAVGALPLDARAFHVAAQTADQRRHIRNGLIKVQRFQRHGCTADELAVGLYRSRDLKILFGQRGFRGRQRFRPFLFRRILDLVIDCLRR